MTRLTASGLDRVSVCAASAALPQGRQAASSYADTGTAVHRFIEETRARAATYVLQGAPYADALETARTELLAAIPQEADHYPLCEGFDWSLVPEGAQLEVALAWDPATGVGRVLGESIERDYATATARELVGTADLVGRIGDRVLVADWKTGNKLVGAAEAWQLRFLAVAAAAAVGASGALVAMVYLRDDRAYIDRAEFDAFDLLVFAAELEQLVARVSAARQVAAAGRVPDVAMGPWCRYCPAMASCPAQVRLVQQLARRVEREDITPERVMAQVQAMTPADAGAAWVKLERAEALLRYLREGLDTYVRQVGDVPLPDGRVLREVPSTRRYLIPRVAEKVIHALDYREPDEKRHIGMDAITYEPVTSMAQIKRALVAHGRKQKEAEAIAGEIDAAGGFESKTSTPVKAVPAGKAVPDVERARELTAASAR